MSGEIKRLSRVEYDRLARVNWSNLKNMKRSPAHYRHGLLEQDQDSDPKTLGRVTHLATYEPERFKAEVEVWEGRRAGNLWKKFQADNAGREIIKKEPAEMAVRIAHSIRSEPTAQRYLKEGRGEQTLLWTWPNGIEAKGRVDWLVKGEDVVMDLKTTRDASPDAFSRQAAAMLYHAQAAYYVDGLKIITGRKYRYLIAAVEPKPPFAACIYELNDDVLDAGRIIYDPLLERLHECTENGSWPSYSQGIEQLVLPIWALPEEENYGGLGFFLPEEAANG